MTTAEKNLSIIQQTILCTFLFGPGAAALTALGSTLSEGKTTLNEAITMLIGGTVIGAIASVASMCILHSSKGDFLSVKIGVAVLCAGAVCSTQLVGEGIINLSTDYAHVMTDEAIGGALVIGTAVATALTAGVCAGTYKVAQYIGKGLFSTTDTPSSQKETTPLIPRDFSQKV